LNEDHRNSHDVPDEKNLAQRSAEDVVEPENALPEVSIGDLPQKLQDACARAGWASLVPVQSKALPYLLARRDLMVQSRTGSGKTGAFLLPILERIDPTLAACQALVLVPTRELAHQVARDAGTLFGEGGVRTVPVFGGAAYGPQLEGFRKGAHVVVGTPGRILDHLLKRTLSLSELSTLVFDEADRMLSMGFYPDMVRIREFVPKRKVHGAMFSATFPPPIVRLAGQFLAKPDFLSLSRDHLHVAEVEHVFTIVPGMKKDRALVRIIELENPVSAIIFCNRKAEVHYVSEVLKRFGYDADELSADLSQGAREKVMARVRKGELRFLVATDLAARGIDIPDLSHVILYEPGEDPEAYIHRAGRTGRAGASGVAISLVAGMEEIKLRQVAEQYGIALQERPVPTDEDVEAIVSQRVTALLEAELRARDSLKAERMRRFLPLARALGEDEDESALMAMLLDDYYQRSLHEPPVKIEPESRRTGEPGRDGRREQGSRGAGEPARGRRRR
jgi:ATP-dependent RNA helicase DeaD